MKQKFLIVAVVVLSLVLALVVGIAIKMELDNGKQDPAPAVTTDPKTPTQSTGEILPGETTAPVVTVPATTEPEETYTWPRDEIQQVTTPATEPTEPVQTQPTQPTEPAETEPEPTSGFIGGAGGPNEGELDPIP